MQTDRRLATSSYSLEEMEEVLEEHVELKMNTPLIVESAHRYGLKESTTGLDDLTS